MDATYPRPLTSRLPALSTSWPPVISSYTVLPAPSASRDWSTYASSTDDPMVMVPPSGPSAPVIIRNNVVLPAPLGPMMPTMPARGSENDRASMSRRSP
jgi:hypothetical protein